jgi:hypothetical protein
MFGSLEKHKMASQVPGCACMLCGEQGHKPSRCPTVRLPPDGFYTGGGGGGGHDHDDDEGATVTLRDWPERSVGDESPSRGQERTPWTHAFPSTPSNGAATRALNRGAQ